MHGWNCGNPMLKDLLARADVICLQEHWLPGCKLKMLDALDDGFGVVSVSSMDKDGQMGILHGRPYGGTAILWRHSNIVGVRSFTMSNCGRSVAIAFPTIDGMCVVVSVYLPCLSNYTDEQELQVLECMSFIEETLLDVVDSSQSHVTVLIMGDFNANFEVFSRDVRLGAVRQLFNDLHLICCDDLDQSGVGYTYCNDSLNQQSYIDHCFISNVDKHFVECVRVMEEGANLSDHNPILIETAISCFKQRLEANNNNFAVENKLKNIIWDLECQNRYRALTEEMFVNSACPYLSCCEKQGGCDNECHKEMIEKCCETLVTNLNMCVDAMQRSTVKYERKQVGGVIWSDELRQLKQRSIDIYDLWKRVGKPRVGCINDERLRVKFLYKNCIKEQKRKFDIRQRERMSFKLAQGDSKGFWRGWKNMRGDRRRVKAHNVNGLVDEQMICEGFSNMFQNNFCNSWDIESEKDKLDKLLCEVHQKFLVNECTMFSVVDVMVAVSQLKTGKAPGLDGLCCESVIYASRPVIDMLTFIVNMCCKHGYVPSNFCIGRIIPVPKKQSVCGNFVDYRPITTVSVITKIFEYCLLDKLVNYAQIDELQFGFTKGGGCERALHVFRSTVQYFNEHGSTVYSAALDISKAYDKLNHCVLLRKLICLGIPADIIKVFVHWMQYLKGVVVWGKCLSTVFCIRSGVRQGGICSTWLFNVYINELILRLRKSGLGCRVCGVYAGCIFYADDIMLVSASVIKLQYMLNICNDFGDEVYLSFNAKKSCCIAVGKNFDCILQTEMVIGRDKIEWVSECIYLGVRILSGKQFCNNVEECRRKFCGSVNAVIQYKNQLSEECIMNIIEKQCVPVLLYGCATWCISKEMIRQINVTFNNAIRRVFNYNQWESVKDIVHGFGMVPVDLYLIRARLLMIGVALCSKREIVNVCGRISMMQKDVREMMVELGIDDVLCKRDIYEAVQNVFSSRLDW